ncbi:hypothetical protein MD484_g7246, partial [Candolleomyces efflorescens]
MGEEDDSSVRYIDPSVLGGESIHEDWPSHVESAVEGDYLTTSSFERGVDGSSSSGDYAVDVVQEYEEVDSVDIDAASSSASLAVDANVMPIPSSDQYASLSSAASTESTIGPFVAEPSSIEQNTRLMFETYFNDAYVQEEERLDLSPAGPYGEDSLLASYYSEFSFGGVEYPLAYVPGAYSSDWTSAASGMGVTLPALDVDGGRFSQDLGFDSAPFATHDGLLHTGGAVHLGYILILLRTMIKLFSGNGS